MKKKLPVFLVVSLLGAGALGFSQTVVPTRAPAALAANPVEPAIEEAIQRDFPGVKTEPVDQHRINGVKVGWVKITNARGSSLIAVTEFGDFFEAAIHHGPRNLPTPVDAVINRLFAGRPTDVTRHISTNYQIVVETDGHRDMLILDAVGKLAGVQPNVQGVAVEGEKAPEDLVKTDAGLAARMLEFGHKHFGPDAALMHIYRDAAAADFYSVVFHTPRDNRNIDVVTNGADMLSRRESLREKDVPAPIIASVQEQFKNAKIVSRHRRVSEFYEFADKTSDGDVITVRIGTNGIVSEVSSDIARREKKLQQEAIAGEPRN
ncbi:MAG: hypothetical protein M3O30_03670 [Planctomycetota bacterium]|nr:hypothetical protein [Planctomycetota bacterium]